MVVGCLVVALAWVALAGSSRGDTGPVLPADGVQSSSLALKSASLGSLIVPGVQSPDAGAQQSTGTDRESSPATRMASRTRFEHLSSARAAKVAREAFPAIVERPAGGPPQVPAGGRITHYVADNAAQLVLPGGKHAVVESAQPMAIENSQ